MGAFWECAPPKSALSRLLALLVASPLCCCEAQALEAPEHSCCCGDPSGEKEPCHRCLCASDDPREIPDPAVVPPQGLGISLAAPPASSAAEFARTSPVALEHPRWTPAPPWHAPPAERRARLVSRLL
jgi:hypothetical protein